MVPVRHIAAPISLLLAFLGCAGADAGRTLAGPWQAAVDTVGDTIVVRTVGGSTWGGSGRLVEGIRIGTRDGADHEMFGRVRALAVTPAGEMLVYDAQVPALRRFGPDGTYLGTIGRAGSGPAEYRNVTGMVVLDDGRIVLNDFGNGRLNVHDADGTLLDTWRLRPAIAELRPLYTHADGVLLHDARIGQGGSREEILVRVSPDGTPGDTLVLPHAGYRPPGLVASSSDGSIGLDLPFTPARAWSVTRAGEVVALLGDRYAINIHRNDGSVLQISRAAAPVPVTDAERAAEEARVTAFFRRSIDGWRWDGPSIPDTKPPISWVHVGEEGRIWVRIAQPGTAIAAAERNDRARSFVREPVAFDVYESDGRFLGQVHAPDALRLRPFPVFDGELVWGIITDNEGVDYVARFHVEVQ